MTIETKVWTTICSVDDLVDNSGICALIEAQDDKQIAIFSMPELTEKVFAIDNFDPIGQANVMYRGIVGSNQGEPIVASPLYKQQYSLKTGRCVQEETEVMAYAARISEQEVQVLL